MGAPRNVPRWFSALWMLLAIYPPTSSPLPSSSSHYPSFLSLLHFLLTPSHPSFPPSCYIPSPCTLLLPPLRVGKGLNRPVQSTTSSTSNLRVSRVLCYVIFSRVARVLPRGKTILFRSFVWPFISFRSVRLFPVRQYKRPIRFTIRLELVPLETLCSRLRFVSSYFPSTSYGTASLRVMHRRVERVYSPLG